MSMIFPGPSILQNTVGKFDTQEIHIQGGLAVSVDREVEKGIKVLYCFTTTSTIYCCLHFLKLTMRSMLLFRVMNPFCSRFASEVCNVRNVKGGLSRHHDATEWADYLSTRAWVVNVLFVMLLENMLNRPCQIRVRWVS